MAYCTTDDLGKYGVSAVALAPIDPLVQAAACDAASAEIDDYLADRYQLPLSAWPLSMTIRTAYIAVYNLFCVRGFNISAGADVNIRLRYEDTTKWLIAIARQEIQVQVTPQQHESAGYDDPRILTNSQRGWTGGRRVLG